MAALAAVSVVACVSESPGPGAPIRVESGTHALDAEAFPFPGITRVWYHLPDSVLSDSTRAVIVVHGAGRNGDDYAKSWTDMADAHGLLIIAPEFGEESAVRMGGRWEWRYNTGNVVGWLGRRQSADQQYFESVERVFDAFEQAIPNLQKEYILFGHSAGGQFVHRMALFRPDARFVTAVAANSGWYTMPDEDQSFPYGLAGAPAVSLDKSLVRPLIIALGLEDSPEQGGFRTDPDAMAQGTSRVARGRAFYRTGQELATERNLPFGWTIHEVPNAEHDYRAMAEATGDLLVRRGLLPN